MSRQSSRTGPSKEQRRPGRGGVETARGGESRTDEATASVAVAQARPDAETVARWLLSRAVRHGTLATIEFETYLLELGLRDLVRGRRLDLQDLARLQVALTRVYRSVCELRPAGTPDAWGLGRP